MAAYNLDTAAQLYTQLTSETPVAGGSGIVVPGGSFDATTASDIVTFLSQAGDFSYAGGTEAWVQGPAPLTGSDSTPHVDVYEITDADFNSSALYPLPTAPALIDTNTGPTTINIFDNYNASILLAANSGGNFINLHDSTGTDTILAGDGANYVLAGNGKELIYLGSGNSSLGASEGQNTIAGYDGHGLSGNDFFQLDGGANTLSSGDGNDTINAFSGKNLIIEGNGNDSINLHNTGYLGNPGTDTITLGSGTDTVNTSDATGYVYGGSGIDSVYLYDGGTWDVVGDTAAAAQGSTDVFQAGDDVDDLGASLNAPGINTIQGGAATTYFNLFGESNVAIGGSGTNVFDVATAEQQTLTGGTGYNLYDLGAYGTSDSTANDTITAGAGYNDININAVSGSISIGGSTAPDNSSVDFTRFSSSDATVTPGTGGGSSRTYTFGSGPTELKVTITDPTTTIKWH